MITYFPILNAPVQIQTKTPFWVLNRENTCTNKLSRIYKRFKLCGKKQIKTQFLDQEQLSKEPIYITNQSKSKNLNFHDPSKNNNNTLCQDRVSFNNTLTLQQQNSTKQYKQQQKMNSKRQDGLHKHFNKTRTDWQHNFIGTKYIQKIKDQLSKTKANKFRSQTHTHTHTHTHNSNKIKLKISQSDSQIIQRNIEYSEIGINNYAKINSSKLQYRRGVSEQQLARIKTIKQTRRNKLNNYKKLVEINKNRLLQNSALSMKQKYNSIYSLDSGKQAVDCSNILPISPWEDNLLSGFSSMWLKKS